jgi:hypothetical protein
LHLARVLLNSPCKMFAARFILRHLKAPLAVFMTLLLLAVQGMVASEVLHEAVCDHGHSKTPAQSPDEQPSHDCVVKLFSQGMVDCAATAAPLVALPPRFSVLPEGSVRVAAADLTLLPAGRAPPAFQA